MKIYSIKDKSLGDQILAYFILYEKTGNCCIELCDDVDEWDLPFILDHYARRGEYSIGMMHTLEFIRQRIIPPDRQNIGSILKDNGLEEYDEIKLFLISDGRCAQDECYIRRIKNEELPQSIKERMDHYIQSVCLCENGDYLVSFQNGEIVLLDRLNQNLMDNRLYKRMLEYASRLGVSVAPPGNYVAIGDVDCISYNSAYQLGTKLPVSMSSLNALVLNNIMSTSEVMETYGCSRQNVNDLVKRGKLTPIQSGNRNMIFSRAEVMKRL